MSRPMIHCPACGRELYHLRRPECLWCGARLSTDEFQQVALPPGTPLPLSQPMPPPPPILQTPWIGRGWAPFAVNPFPLIKRSVSPWERKLRITGAALFVCVLLARLAEIVYNVWRMHQLLPSVH